MTAPAWRSAGTYASGTGDVTPGLPGGYQADDIFLMFVEFDGNDTPTIAAPTGWQAVPSVDGDNEQRTGAGSGSTGTGGAVFWRRAQASETAPTITDTGDHTSAIIHAFSGCAAAAPIHAKNANWNSSESTSVFPVGSLTTTMSNCLIVLGVTHGVDTASANFTSWSGGFTERSDNSHTDGSGGGIGVATATQVAAGAVAGITVTMATASSRSYYSIALAPANELARPEYGVLVDWNNDGDFSDANEDITARVLRSGAIKLVYGRDQARSLGAIRAGETGFSVNNESKDYSPENASSPLAGDLEPGRPVLIRATFGIDQHDLFRGFLDDYALRPSATHKVSTVEFTALDLLHKLKQAILSTEVYESLQSGEAIHVLLDEIGWPEDARDIDQGATTLRWWWEEDVDGLTALKRIVDSEGPASFAFVGADGNFVFRSRHHRFIRTASTTVQSTFRASTTEPCFSEPFEYNIGWKDLINQVVIEVSEREPQPTSVVWSSESPVVIEAGETWEIEIKGSSGDPIIEAITPTVGNGDIELTSGTLASSQISRKSGQSLKIVLVASTTVYLKKLQLRAQAVTVARKVKVTAENTDSILRHGVRTDQNITPVWANANDALAIAKIVVAQRGDRLPVVSITVNNGTAGRVAEILSRDLSDRIHIVETGETGVDDDFFIEQISHEIGDAGKAHRAVFGCERVWLDTTSTPNYFTFGKAGSGFNDGVFGEDGQVQSDKLFILDNTGDNGKLDVAGLGF